MSQQQWTNFITVVFQCCGASFTHRERNITDVGLLVDLCECSYPVAAKPKKRNILIIGACDNVHFPRTFTVYTRLDKEPAMQRRWALNDDLAARYRIRMPHCQLPTSHSIHTSDDATECLLGITDYEQLWPRPKPRYRALVAATYRFSWAKSMIVTAGMLRKYCSRNTNVNAVLAEITILAKNQQHQDHTRRRIQIVVTSDIRDWRHAVDHTMGLLVNTITPMRSNIGDEDAAVDIALYYTLRDNKSVDALIGMYEDRCDHDLFGLHFGRTSTIELRNDELFWINEKFRRDLQSSMVSRAKTSEQLAKLSSCDNKAKYYKMFPSDTYGEPYAVILNTIDRPGDVKQKRKRRVQLSAMLTYSNRVKEENG